MTMMRSLLAPLLTLSTLAPAPEGSEFSLVAVAQDPESLVIPGTAERRLPSVAFPSKLHR